MTTPNELTPQPASKIKPIFTPASRAQVATERMRRIAELAAQGMTLAEAKARLERE